MVQKNDWSQIMSKMSTCFYISLYYGCITANIQRDWTVRLGYLMLAVNSLSLTKRQPKTRNSLKSGRKSAFNPLPAVCKRWKTSGHAECLNWAWSHAGFSTPQLTVCSPKHKQLWMGDVPSKRWSVPATHTPVRNPSKVAIHCLYNRKSVLEAYTWNGGQSHLSFVNRTSLQLKCSEKVTHYFHSLARWKAIFEGRIWGRIWEGFSQGESSNSMWVSIYSAAAAFYL